MKVKRLSAAAVKRLPVGTYIERRSNSGNSKAAYIIVRSGTKKILSLVGLHEVTRKIEDTDGWHFVVPERD